MSKNKQKRQAIYLNLSHLLDGEKFDGFKELRKKSNEIVRDYRENFVRVLFFQKKIPYDSTMTRREKCELFDEHQVGIILDEDNNTDKVLIGDKIIGEWFNDFSLFFQNGKLICKIEYSIHK